MKKNLTTTMTGLVLTLFLSGGLLAQTELKIQMTEDGKMVKDTTITFDDKKEACHAIKVIEMMNDEDMHHAAHHEYKGSKAVVYISGDDGEEVIIKEFHGDSATWTHKEGNKKVIVMKHGDGETFDIIMDEDEDFDMDVDVEVKKVMKQVDGEEEVEVIVIKKKVHKHEGEEEAPEKKKK